MNQVPNLMVIDKSSWIQDQKRSLPAEDLGLFIGIQNNKNQFGLSFNEAENRP